MVGLAVIFGFGEGAATLWLWRAAWSPGQARVVGQASAPCRPRSASRGWAMGHRGPGAWFGNHSLRATTRDKQPAATQEQRLVALRGLPPADWSNVTVTVWAGLTAAFCHVHRSGVIVRGIRNHTDLRHEYQLAAMNEELGITTLLVPARPGLATLSSTAMRALRA